MYRIGKQIPDKIVKIREYDFNTNNFIWIEKNSLDIFTNKKIMIFSFSSTFIPEYSTDLLIKFEKEYENICKHNIEQLYCVGFIDDLKFNSYIRKCAIKNLQMISDMNGGFTEDLAMVLDKENFGFGPRSDVYAMLVENNIITQWVDRKSIGEFNNTNFIDIFFSHIYDVVMHKTHSSVS